jgi:hypothetical protein
MINTVGARVLLRTCPHGEAGTVTGFRRGRILVNWTDLDIAGTHRPEQLESAPSVPESNGSEHAIPALNASPEINSLKSARQQHFWNTQGENTWQPSK